MIADLTLLYRREIESLQRELALFPDDASLWVTLPGMPNSAGTLFLHLCGNLRHFLGATLGASGFVRDRDREFSRRDESKAVINAELGQTLTDVVAALEKLTPSQLSAPYPIVVGKDIQTTTQRFLLHLLSHMAYHLGQIDYARRIVTGDAAGAGVQPMPVLRS